eukprot:11007177-Prorocentrum_lima.AAC.1
MIGSAGILPFGLVDPKPSWVLGSDHKRCVALRLMTSATHMAANGHYCSPILDTCNTVLMCSLTIPTIRSM